MGHHGPRKTVGADLFAFYGRDYLILVDYCSGFIEVEPMVETTSKAIIAKLRQQFTRQGIPLTLLTNIGLQFVSKEACQLSNKWEFRHRTLICYNPQSNGKPESGVNMVKHLMTKALADSRYLWLSRLELRNTPTVGMSSSPVTDCSAGEKEHCYL